MPTELQIIRASEFVRLSASGYVDFEGSKKTLQVLAEACRTRGVDRALLDLRGLPVPDQPLFTPSELAALVGTFREAGFSANQRLAVLYQSDPHHGARTFAFISRLRGWKVRAFDDFEEALLWLSEEEQTRSASGEKAAPIRVSTRKVDVEFRKQDPARKARR